MTVGPLLTMSNAGFVLFTLFVIATTGLTLGGSVYLVFEPKSKPLGFAH